MCRDPAMHMDACSVQRHPGDCTLRRHDSAARRSGRAPRQTEPDVGTAVIHYYRADGDYDGWGLHVWEDTTESVTWADPLPPTGEDDFGLYWTVGVAEDGETLGFIVHKGEEKDPGPDQFLDLTTDREAWILSGDTNVYTEAPDPNAIVVGNISRQAAYWVDSNTILWDVADLPPDAVITLHYSANAGMTLGQAGVSGEGIRDLALTRVEDGPSAAVLERFPHLADYAAFTLPANAPNPAVLVRSQLAITALGADGDLLDASGLQLAGVLDEIAYYDGQLGAVWEGDTPTLKLWAPTAKNVRLFLYDDPAADEPAEIVNMRRGRGEELSVWSVEGKPDWQGMYYRYEVRVFVPSTASIETNLVTDPYSFSLSSNSSMSQIVDLNNPALMPDGWQTLEKPPLEDFADIVLYELHIRDFSIYDESVPAGQRGTYLAFAQEESNGVAHLRSLADAGLTHLHLLPSFDIATIDENKANWVELDPAELAALPPDSEDQQALIGPIRNQDGFNWGYDPFHYTVPEGSYSTDPGSTARILEYRQMVQALNQMGLRVVSDVVYNHTNASGQADKSVLDQIVPGYYHRLNRNGLVETSTCCANTATENAMMRKLMLDSLVTWATQYKIDGFRFDLMGHHMLDDMIAVRATLDSLTEEEDGVDGSKIYVYGEGWDFGEVAGNARGINATQINAAGTGIGTFNDRLRDAVRGVGPFDQGEDLRKQGFISGLVLDPNEVQGEPTEADLRRLLHETDWIRIGMTGNLRDYVLIDGRGAAVSGAQIDYNGAPAGYTLDPQESINYASAHDNQTLFDALVYGAPQSTSMAERVKMQQLALSVVGLGQGIPFFHAGSDLLRSKSFDRNSYDSGDWFNAIDWTYNDNNFGHGLPLAEDNQDDWAIMQPLLADPAIKPSQADMTSTANYFRTLLAIRRSSPLLRLETAAQINEMVRFHNTGPDQIPGLIVQSITERGSEDVDPDREAIFVLINARPDDVEFSADWLVGQELTLHPLLALQSGDLGRSSFDSETGTFTIPGRTAAVFEAGEVTETFVDGLDALDAQIDDLLANPPALPEDEETPAADRPVPDSVSFPGTIGSVLGGADWAPDDAAVQAADEDNDGMWTLNALLPAGDYEFKAAVNGSWDENYGLGGAPGGDNIALSLSSETEVTLVYDRATDAVYVTDGEGNVLAGEAAAQPAEPAEPTETAIDSVSFPGSYAPQIGGVEWEPADPTVQAADEDGDGVWTLTVPLAGGDYEFKAAVNGSWDVNYGLNGEVGGANVPLSVPAEGGTVTFSFNAANNEVSATVGEPQVGQEAPSFPGDGQIGRNGLRHDSRSDAYRVPFGAVPEGTDVVLRFRTYANDVEAVRLVLQEESSGARSSVPMDLVATTPSDEGNGYSWWQTNVNVGTAPTIHTYTFEIADGDTVVYYSDNGGDGGLGSANSSPPAGGGRGAFWDIYTYVPGFESPDWAKNAVIYQIFPDRFRNGNPDNDHTADDWFYPEERGHVFPVEPWNTIVPDPQPNDPGANPDWYATWSSTFYGGDLQGVIEKLDYLQELGVTAIYFNPIFESPSNHRYDGRTFDEVDDNLGVLGDPAASLAVLEELGRAAEERGMHLILDGVPNHLSTDAYIFDRYGRHDVEGGCESLDSPYRDWFFFREASTGSGECAGNTTYEKWAGVSTLPQLDNTNPDVVENWLGEDGVAVRWLSVPAVDGWRIDVVPDVVNLNPRFFEQFRDVVKAAEPDAMLYAETWFEPDVRARVLGDEFDSTMNYRFRAAVLGFLRDGDWQDGDGTIRALSAPEFDDALRALQEDYPPAAWQSAMNLISSHDVNRALRVLDHDDIDYGTLEPANDFEDGRKRLRLAAVLQFTLPGAPTIYYGDEVGLVGFGSDVPRDDPYNRQPYPWPDEAGYDDLPSWRQQQTDLLAHYRFLGQLRGQYSFLRTGTWTTFTAEDGLYVYGRKDESGAAVIAVNRGDAPANVDLNLTGFVPLDAEMIDAVSGDVIETPLNATVGPMEFAIWISEADTDLSQPETPTILSATAAESQITLEIDVADPTATSVIVWKSAVDGGYEPVQQSPIEAPITFVYTEAELPNGQPVYYRVSAVKANGIESVRSAEVMLIPSFEIDAAMLLEPLDVETVISAITPTRPIQGMVLIEGVTEADGAAASVRAELGLTTVLPGVVPPVEVTMWIPGAYSGELDGADVYTAQVTPEMTGEYSYGWRFSTTGGEDWVYADAGGIVAGPPFEQPGALTVLPSDDREAPNRPFRISEVFASPGQIVMEWRASRTTDLHAYAVCRRDVTANEDDPCATRFLVPRDTQIFTDTAVIINHTYEYTVQTVDTSFNASEPSDVLTSTAAENFVDVTFLVRVPDFTPADDVIVIAGDDRDIFGGEWTPVQPMVQVEDNLWSYTVTVKEGTPLQYKYTRGSWETVEQWDTMTGMANRPAEVVATPEGVALIDNTATDWGDGEDSSKAVRNWRDPLVTDVSVEDGVITVTFNAAVVPTAEMGEVITLSDADGAALPGAVAQVNEKTFTFTPDSPVVGSVNLTVFNVATDVAMVRPFEGEVVIE